MTAPPTERELLEGAGINQRSTWPWARAKIYLKEVDEPSPTGAETLFSLSKDLGIVPRHTITDREPSADTLVGYKTFRANDIIMNKMQAWNGMFGLAPAEGIISPDYAVFRPNADVDPRYVTYLFRTPQYVELFRHKSRGIGTGFLRLHPEHLLSTPVPNPPLSEQRAIADFLDHETTRIDTVMDHRMRTRALLDERRRALVDRLLISRSHRGKEATWQGSWRDLLGLSVPEEWSPKPLKYYLSVNDSGTWGEEPSGAGDTLVLRSTEITREGTWSIEDPAYRTVATSERARCRLRPGDLLVVTSSGSPEHIGKTAVVGEGVAKSGAVFSNFTQRLRTRDADPHYFWYFLNSTFAREQLGYLSSTSTGLRNLNAGVLGELVTPGAPIDEQCHVRRQLDEETAQLDRAIGLCDRYIASLRRYRSASVSAAIAREPVA